MKLGNIISATYPQATSSLWPAMMLWFAMHVTKLIGLMALNLFEKYKLNKIAIAQKVKDFLADKFQALRFIME